ncbi:MAG: WD40 repeat domain-containing protein [Nostocales cyanobacterium 94392]|nr:WD40 repeat domain-containing protein [Nostocales cyanobacterium 94392]
MDVNSINLLKAQQADFLERIKKPKTYEISLLESSFKGCHREFMAFWGERLTLLLENARLQAEILARNPPPIPSEYPEDSDWAIPFPTHFQHQAQIYLLREFLVEEVMKACFGKLVKKIPLDVLTNIPLDDEGNLRGESKFSFMVTNNPEVKIRVCVSDSESFNSLKKDKVRWTITQEDLKNYQVFFFLCLFFPGSGQRGYEKESLITGFLPTNQIEFNGSQTHIKPSKLLYAGGFSWYLNLLKSHENLLTKVDTEEPKTIPTISSNHPRQSTISEWQCSQTLTGHIKGINCLALTTKNNHSSQSLIASGSWGEIKIWDFKKGDLITTLSEHPWGRSGIADEINDLAFSPDGQTLASCGADSTIKIWHLGAKDLIDIMHKHNGMVRCLTFTADGRILATGGDDRKIQFWDMTERQVAMTLSLDDTAAHSLIFSRDGKTFVTGSYRKIKVWQIDFHKELSSCIDVKLEHSFAGHSHIVRSLAVSKDGKFLVSASTDKTIKVWDLKTGKLLRILEGHEDGVYAIAISEDDKNIASGSADKTIKLWHLETGELCDTFTGHNNTVTGVAFAEKENILVSASLDKTIKIWQRS